MVESLIETTDGLAPGERWSFWKDTAMAAVDGVHLGDRSAFSARRSMVQLTDGMLVDTASSPLSAQRPAGKIARDGDDGVCLMLLRAGRALVDQTSRGGGEMAAGGSMLFDLAHPYAVAVPTPYREVRLYVPRALFAARVGPVERMVGLQFSPEVPLAGLFNRYLADVVAALPAMSRPEADAGLDGILHLLAGLVASRPGALRDGDGRRDGGERLSPDGALDLADRHIAALLADPGFDAAALARVLGLSRARLYRAFAERGGVAAAIRDARLDRARSLITAPADGQRTLAEIAYACGFTDYANFCRAFARRFGLSPRDARGR